MKSLKESLFDDDLVAKEITIGQWFNVEVLRHEKFCREWNADKKVANDIKEEIETTRIETLDCKSLLKVLHLCAKKYTKNWSGGQYSYSIYDNSNNKIKQIKNIDLLNDVSKISLYSEDWSGRFETKTFCTDCILTRI